MSKLCFILKPRISTYINILIAHMRISSMETKTTILIHKLKSSFRIIRHHQIEDEKNDKNFSIAKKFSVQLKIKNQKNIDNSFSQDSSFINNEDDRKLLEKVIIQNKENCRKPGRIRRSNVNDLTFRYEKLNKQVNPGHLNSNEHSRDYKRRSNYSFSNISEKIIIKEKYIRPNNQEKIKAKLINPYIKPIKQKYINNELEKIKEVNETINHHSLIGLW